MCTEKGEEVCIEKDKEKRERRAFHPVEWQKRQDVQGVVQGAVCKDEVQGAVWRSAQEIHERVEKRARDTSVWRSVQEIHVRVEKRARDARAVKGFSISRTVIIVIYLIAFLSCHSSASVYPASLAAPHPFPTTNPLLTLLTLQPTEFVSPHLPTLMPSLVSTAPPVLAAASCFSISVYQLSSSCFHHFFRFHNQSRYAAQIVSTTPLHALIRCQSKTRAQRASGRRLARRLLSRR